MAQSIILKRSAQPGKVPTITSLNVGEIAINTYDGKIFLNRSGSSNSIQEIITTNVINTGSIALTQTGSFGELVVSNDANIKKDLYVVGDVITNGNIDISGSITGSALRIAGGGSFYSLQVNNTLTVNHGETIISGSQLITNDLTILGTVNARQFNISVISSSILFESGSSKFGDTFDDIHSFTGSLQITGSLIANSISSSYFFGDGSGLKNVIISPANDYDFNVDTPSSGLVGYLTDSGSNYSVVPTQNEIKFKYTGNTFATISNQYGYSGSIYGINNPLEFSQSVDYRINNLVLNSGYASSASFNSFTSSYSIDSASFDDRIKLATNEGQFATTGSNSFTGSQYIKGDISISGSIQIGYSITQTYMLESSVLNNNTISTINTGSYTGAFYNYSVSNGINARAGQMMAVWHNGGISFTETLTTDIGNTSPVSFNAALNGGSVQLVANTSTPGWKIRLIQQFI